MMKTFTRKSSYRNGLPCKGFTLVEVICVVSIVGILASVAIPSFLKYMNRAKTLEALGTLRTLYDAEIAWSIHVQKGTGRGTGLSLYNPAGTGCNLGTG